MSTDTPPTPTGANGICIAFSDNWNKDNTNTTWTRIDDPTVPSLGYVGSGETARSHVVTSWSSDRGRSYELDKTQAGTATVTLFDTSGIFDPTNPASPYAASIGPMKRAVINIQNPVTGVYSDIFTGYLESYDWTVDQAEKLMTVTLHLVDGFEPLTRSEVVPDGTGTTTYAAQQVNDRIFALLADANWPAALTNVNTGNVDVQQTVYNPGTQILSGIQDAADAEFPGVANVYMDRHGNLAFRGRWPRFQPQDYTHQVHFWEVGDRNAADTFGYAPISAIGWNLDQKDLYNAALVYPYGIQQGAISGQLVTSPSSITKYGVRTISIDDLIVLENLADSGHGFPTTLDANATCLLYSNYYVDNFAAPVQRISNLVFKTVDPLGGTPNEALWEFMCNVEIGDVITVLTSNPGGGGINPYTQYGNQFFVEGIHNVVNPLAQNYPDWTMTLDVSPRAWFSIFNGVTYYSEGPEVSEGVGPGAETGGGGGSDSGLGGGGAGAPVGIIANIGGNGDSSPQATAVLDFFGATSEDKWIREDRGDYGASFAAANGIKRIGIYWPGTLPAAALDCDAVELDNEPYWSGVNPASWASTVRGNAIAIKAAHPAKTVLLPLLGFANNAALGAGFDGQGNYTYGGVTKPWVTWINDATPDIWQYVDGYAVHPYAPRTAPSFAGLDQIRSELELIPTAAGKPFWATEIGWATNGSNPSDWYSSESAQSSDFSTFISTWQARGDTGPMTIYQIQDLGTSGSSEMFYGLLRHDGSHKPAYATVQGFL